MRGRSIYGPQVGQGRAWREWDCSARLLKALLLRQCVCIWQQYLLTCRICIEATVFIRGQCLFHLLPSMVQCLFKGGVYSRKYSRQNWTQVTPHATVPVQLLNHGSMAECESSLLVLSSCESELPSLLTHLCSSALSGLCRKHKVNAPWQEANIRPG